MRRIARPSEAPLTGSILVAISVLLASPGAAAEPSAKLSDRLTLDVGYEFAYSRQRLLPDYYTSDPTTGRLATTMVAIEHNTATHGIVLGPGITLRPRLGLALEVSVHEDLSTPGHPWLERIGVHLGRRRIWGLGVVFEVRPWQRRYGPREGWFFRAGLRRMWVDYRVESSSQTVSPSAPYDDDGMIVGVAGYRVPLGSGMSLSAQGFGGLTNLGGLLGVRVAGGFH